jgi:iron(III) transport system permease protein
VGLAVVLGGLLAVPLAAPLLQLAGEPAAWDGWEPGRLLGLVRNTAWLVGGTLLLALPAGVAGAVLLYRTDLPLRRLFRFLAVLTLFVPLPLFATGWQAVLGSGGWLPLGLWNAPRATSFAPDSAAWTPWGQGIGSAVWIHAVAGLPWVILLAGQGLLGVERSLEEDAWTALPAWRVVLKVSLPRAGAAIAAAALWVSLQAAGEITVTDVMQVRTFAEEVYTQFVGPEVGRAGALPRAVAVTLPGVLVTAALVVVLARRWERRLPTAGAEMGPALTFPLGRWGWPLALLVGAAGIGLAGVPLGSLVWRAGLTGAPRSWSAGVVLDHLRLVWQTDHQFLRDSLLVAVGAGVSCALLGLLTCWAAVGTRHFRGGVLVLMATAWSLPGPVIGLGLKDTIGAVLEVVPPPVLVSPEKASPGKKAEEHLWIHPVSRALWYGPSPVPLWWVDLIRFFPCAVALLWPVVRLVPPELRDAARVDGATPWQELRHVVWPRAAGACGRAALAAGVLSLGELSAGKLVSTPGFPSCAEVVFTQMHYGVTNDLAARCLLLLAAVTAGAVALAAGPPAARVLLQRYKNG